MKKQFYFLLFLIIILKTSYSQNYYPLIESSKYWDVFSYASPPECNYFTWCNGSRYFFEGDSVLNNITYKKLMAKSFSQLTGSIYPPYPLSSEASVYGLMREDIINKKVYFQDITTFPQVAEIVLYDFNLQVGDSIVYEGSINAKLDSIRNYTLLNGEIRKIFYFHFTGSCTQCYYIEGIGGAQGLLYPLGICFEFSSELTCVKTEIDPLYSIGAFMGAYNSCDLATSSNKNLRNDLVDIIVDEKSNQIKIFNLNISADNTIKLIDLTGKTVFHKIFKPVYNNYEINLGKEFCTGIYFIEIYNKYDQITKKLFIK